jgi:hypothetical protein
MASGLACAIASARLFVGGRYHHVRGDADTDTQLLPITFGVRSEAHLIGVGGNRL